MRIKIDGDIYTVKEVVEDRYHGMATITTMCGKKFTLAEDIVAVREIMAEYYRDMAYNSKQEFMWLLSDYLLDRLYEHGLQGVLDTLTSDSDEVDNFVSSNPQMDVQRIGRLLDEIDFRPTLAWEIS